MEQLKTLGRELAMSTHHLSSSSSHSKEFLDLIKSIGESRSKSEGDRIILHEIETLKRSVGSRIPKRKMKEFIIRLLKLGLGEVKPTQMTLQMADRSYTYPRGVFEDVLVKIDKFILLVDFVVLDMEEDDHVPIILGISFLATGGALIDVQSRELKIQIEG